MLFNQEMSNSFILIPTLKTKELFSGKNLPRKHWMQVIQEKTDFNICFSTTETQPTVMKYDWDSKTTAHKHH